jgi:TENA/THI-4/PQQC family
MTGAVELIANIQMELEPINQKIVNHRYLTALEKDKVKRESLTVFAAQQYHIIGSDLRSIALLMARHGDLPSRAYLLDLLLGENAAAGALPKFARAFGMSDEELSASQPIPEAFAYSAFVAWLGLYGSDAELAAAFQVNLAAWGANCRRMSAALRGRFGLEAEAVSFFDLFANLPPRSDAASAVVQHGLHRGIAAASIARAARLLQGYELLFWESLAQEAAV